MKEEKKYSRKAIISFVLIIICILWGSSVFFVMLNTYPMSKNDPYLKNFQEAYPEQYNREYLFSYDTGESISNFLESFFLYIPIICLVSIVLGIMGIIEIKKNKNLKGMWLAISSLVLSISLGVIIVLMGMFAAGLP